MKSLPDSFELSLPPNWQSQLPTGELVTDAAKMQFVVQLAGWNIRNQHGGPFSAAVFESRSARHFLWLIKAYHCTENESRFRYQNLWLAKP